MATACLDANHAAICYESQWIMERSEHISQLHVQWTPGNGGQSNQIYIIENTSQSRYTLYQQLLSLLRKEEGKGENEVVD